MQLAIRRSSLNMDLEREIEILEKSFNCRNKGENRSALYSRFWQIYRQLSENEAVGYGDQWYLVYRFANLAYMCREYDVAQKYFIESLDLIPDHESKYIRTALEKLGYIFLEKKAYDEAVVHFEKSLKVFGRGDQKEPAVWNGMAYAYFGCNRFTEAIECAEKAIEQTHDVRVSESACFLLAFCNGVRMNKKKESRYTNRLLKLGPDNPNLDYLV